MEARAVVVADPIPDCPRRSVFVNRAVQPVDKWEASRFYVMSDDTADTFADSFGKSAAFRGHSVCSFLIWLIWPSTLSEACPATPNSRSATRPLARSPLSPAAAHAEKHSSNHRAAVHALVVNSRHRRPGRQRPTPCRRCSAALLSLLVGSLAGELLLILLLQLRD